jgi:cytochrome b
VATADGPERAKVWDLPIRLFHWSLVLLIGAAWATQEQLSDNERHAFVGYAILTLLLFRLLWGLVGSETARFASFLRGPAKVWAYLRGSGGISAEVGHNPIGGYSVALMLTLIAVQVGTGLFLSDDDFFAPWSAWVSEDTADLLHDVHELNFNLLLGVIALHVAAILFYAIVKRRNLVRPMLSGVAPLPPGAPRPRIASSLLALVLLLVAAALVYVMISFA